MFTGLIEEQGVVRSISCQGEGVRMVIEAEIVVEGLEVGDSVAVNGCCLTAVEVCRDRFSVDLVPETVGLTSFTIGQTGEHVNLERALRVGDRLGGHIVQGHVDGLAEVLQLQQLDDGSARLRVRVPRGLAALVAHKGSITLSGVSLTVAEVHDVEVEVALVPHTLAMTNLGAVQPGLLIQVEVDVLARYLHRQLEMIEKAGS